MPSHVPDLKSVFNEALERPTGPERSDYLDRACRGDDALRAQVQELLDAHGAAGRFLAGGTGQTADDLPAGATREATGILAPTSPVTLEAPSHTETPGTALFHGQSATDDDQTAATSTSPLAPSGRFVPGQVIAGRYRLIEILGEGGMGTVYRAEQTQPVKRPGRAEADQGRHGLPRGPGPLRRRAAGAGADGPPQHRQGLRRRHHRGRPAVLRDGAGQRPARSPTTATTSGCRSRRGWSCSSPVCQAVQHAHQKGIIHRDLKPSNVLVTEVDGRPTPKVIDFGVAKATEFKLTDESLIDTGAIVGTPTYMSPEQADPSSMDIDTRTDIYALGVILYELLAGSPPIDAKPFKKAAFLEMLRMVREVEPPSPSTRLSKADDLAGSRPVAAIEPRS